MGVSLFSRSWEVPARPRAESVPTPRAASSRRLDTDLEAMDELAAAAAVAATSVESDSEEEMELEGSPDEQAGRAAPAPASEVSPADKENINGDAAQCEAEDVSQQVSPAPQIPRSTRVAKRFARHGTHC